MVILARSEARMILEELGLRRMFLGEYQEKMVLTEVALDKRLECIYGKNLQIILRKQIF